jgi:ABC-type transport system involved in cytochrome bd biosynthesis fused ATPase/permease subunit
MEQLTVSRTRLTPLEQAKSHEQAALWSVALVVGVVVIVIVRGLVVAAGETAAEQQRLMIAVAPVVQFVVSLATFALIRNQVSVAVAQIGQAEHSEARLLQLAYAVHALRESLNPAARAESGRYGKAQDEGRVAGIAPVELDGAAAAVNGARHDRQAEA